MYLQRIELSGFKSFANKSILEFPAPDKNSKECGITSIVGPNGSGKSNVVDAVRWVLGEQSLKLLRGKKSTDVIFSGSAKKSQMSLAEVSLYLNNEDGNSPIDYSEIVITRKLYRDGSSEYLLNKQEVRLFDIVMLLAKANFGHNTYSIIGQGMVDRIVNYSNEERKEFFDEATGVKQYQIKRDRSVSKLKRSRENLTQAKTLLFELEPHLKSLTRQVNKLHQRQTIEKELKDYQSSYYGKLWQDLSVLYDEHALNYNTYEKQSLRLENSLMEIRNKLEELSNSASRTEEYDKLQEIYNFNLNKQNELLKELSIVRGKLEIEYDKVGKHDLSFLENKKVELENKIKEIEIENKSLNLRWQGNQQKLSDKEKRLEIITDELLVWQNNLDIMQEEYYRLKSGGSVSYHLESVKKILELRDSVDGICGIVSELGQIKNSKYEVALAVAAGNRLSAVVVDNDSVAVKCIKWLKDNRLPPVTFFPLNRLREFYLNQETREILQESGVIGLAFELLKFDDKYFKVFQQIFGSTLVVENLEVAKDIGINRERMVTLDGDILEKTGVMKGGYKKPESLTWKTLEDKFFPEAKIKEIASLKAKLEEQRREKESLLSIIANLRSEVTVDNERINNFKVNIDLLKKELSKINNDLNSAQLTPEQLNDFLNELKNNKNQLEADLVVIENDLNLSRLKLDEFNLSEEKKKQEIFSLQQQLYDLQNELNKINQELSLVKIDLAKVETRKEDVLVSIKENLGNDWEFDNKNNYNDINLDDYKNKIDKLKKQLELIGGIDPEVEKEYLEVKTRFDFLSGQSEDLEKAIKDLEKIVSELDKLIKKQFESEFEKINKDFSRYFKQLFEGGNSKLTLVSKEEEQTEAEKIREQIKNEEVLEEVDSSDKLEEVEEKIIHPEDRSFLSNMGIEIEACPPGKKIKSMTSLSGGEKTMTALALVCAIINNNPSPFILFDEVDAALDESNSTKFSKIIRELSHKTQFVIITHNRAIMSGADVLYGVTMQGDGVSRLLSLKLEEAKEMVKE